MQVNHQYVTATSVMVPGAIITLGCHGGAYTTQYRVESVIRGKATLVPVEAQSRRNPDGTFSTVYVDLCHAPAGTGQSCGAANACRLFKGHYAEHVDWYGDKW